jgi:hypothetical protein
MRCAVKISGWDHARLKLRHYRRNPQAWRAISMLSPHPEVVLSTNHRLLHPCPMFALRSHMEMCAIEER